MHRRAVKITDNMVGIIDSIIHNLRKKHNLSSPYNLDDLTPEIQQWLTNETDSVRIADGWIWFEDKEDATLFCLTFS